MYLLDEREVSRVDAGDVVPVGVGHGRPFKQAFLKAAEGWSDPNPTTQVGGTYLPGEREGDIQGQTKPACKITIDRGTYTQK